MREKTNVRKLFRMIALRRRRRCVCLARGPFGSPAKNGQHPAHILGAGTIFEVVADGESIMSRARRCSDGH